MAAALVVVVVVYALAWRRGEWPLGHPWSAATVLLLGAGFSRFPQPEGRLLAAAGLVTSLAWVVSAVRGR